MLIPVAIAVVVLGGGVAGAMVLMKDDEPTTSAGPSESTRASTTTTTGPTTTTTTVPVPPALAIVQPQPVSLPPVPGGVVGPGASGPEVQAYQQRLTDLKFDPGVVDGNFGPGTTFAVQALQKLMFVPITGQIGEPERQALEQWQYKFPGQLDGEPNRTEVDIATQTMILYENYQPRLITTVSTGSGENYCYNTPRENPTQRICEDANTPSGRYTYYFFYDGWHKGVLGSLYNPFYFNKGIAVHGYESVPPYPASHGCVRIPMHIAEYFHTLVRQDDPVYVFGGTDAVITSSEPLGGSAPVPDPEPVPPPGEPAPPPETTPPDPVPPPEEPPPVP